MKTLITICMLAPLVSIFHLKAYAQGATRIEWLRNYTGIDSSVAPQAITVDNWGNLYVAGYIETDSTRQDYLTIKYDANGSETWIARYNGAANLYDYGVLISVDNSGGVYVCGNSMDSTYHNDIVTIKYSSDGSQQWIKRYGGSNDRDDMVKAMSVDGSGNVFLLGSSWGPVTKFDYVTIKYSTDGVIQWSFRYNDYEDSWDLPKDLIVDALGNFYVTGNTDRGINISNDFLTIKYDSNDNLQWKANYGEPQPNDVAIAITIDRFENVYVSGISMGDYTTIKYDMNGIEQWIRTYDGDGNGEDHVVDITADKEDNIYITGYSSPRGFTTVKYNSDGLELWHTSDDGTSAFPLGVQVNDNGEVYIAGGTSEYHTGRDFFVVKYDSTGQQKWVTRHNSQRYYDDRMTAFFVDNSNNVYVTGATGELDQWNEDWLWSIVTTIKYSEGTTGLISEEEDILPDEYILSQNYPNPFNSSTTIEYTLSRAEFATLKIFNTAGKQVQNLFQGRQSKGKHAINWSAEQFSSGLYFYQLQAGDFIQTRKLLLLK